MAVDEPSLLTMMREQLENLGYQVVPVRTGAAAWNLIESGLAFDILISDIVMPGGIGGYELARRVARKDPDIPIILLSGYAGHSDEVASDVTAQFLTKPCPPDVLDKALRTLLDQRVKR